MPAPEVMISKIGPESAVILRGLFEHYLRDMSEWFEIATHADGSCAYDISSIWADGYEAYLAKVGDSLAGFALVGSAAEWLSDHGAQDVHEFFVLREFRRSGVGRKIAALLWNERPGEWLVRVLEANAPAVAFWRTAISSHAGGSIEEQTRIVKGRPWRFFRFTAPACR